MFNPYGGAGYTTDNLLQGRNNDYFDAESQLYEDDKYSRQIRHGFIRKVYGILFSQLLLTTIIGAIFTVNKAAQMWLIHNSWVVMVSCIPAIVILLILLCVPGMTHKTPANYILLFVFTAFESISIGGACGITSANSSSLIVLQALIATAVITCGLTLFAMQSKYDFTSFTGVMFYIFLGAMIFGFLGLFFKGRLFNAAICSVFSLIFCAYIVIDTQIMLGKGNVRASEDDYIFCALSLYLDIINLFLYLLRLLRLMESNN